INCFYGRNYLYFLIMLVMSVYIVYRIAKGKNDISEYGQTAVCIFVALYEFLGVFIYSFFINPNGSIFVARYFVAIIPELVYIFSFFMTIICVKFRKNNKNAVSVMIMILLLSGIVGGYSGFKEALGFQTNEALMAKNIQEKYSGDNSLIAFVSPNFDYSYNGIGYAFDGWREFFFGRYPYKIFDKANLTEIEKSQFDKIIIVGDDIEEKEYISKIGFKKVYEEDIPIDEIGIPYHEITFYTAEQ
ncbi:MAG: hypothetical protein K5894_15755, partial [Lachnospiraceae bacterium]|nr:hypothetical protein [Lachnospiraceae bacterium]